jgi:hypothetical protein
MTAALAAAVAACIAAGPGLPGPQAHAGGELPQAHAGGELPQAHAGGELPQAHAGAGAELPGPQAHAGGELPQAHAGAGAGAELPGPQAHAKLPRVFASVPTSHVLGLPPAHASIQPPFPLPLPPAHASVQPSFPLPLPHAPAHASVQSSVQPSAFILIVSGLGGEPRWSNEFHEWGAALADAAVQRYGVPAANLIWLAERADRDARIRGRSTTEHVAAAFAELARRVPADGQLFVFLMGHGAYDGRESKINLPGPDPSAADFAQWLDRFATQRVALVNTTSSSGGWVEKLAAPNRVIVTATRSGMERNETVFGRFFVRAYTQDVADIDKDGRVSLLEAFDYARAEVERFYSSQNRIQTERALIDDTGTGRGVTEIAQADGAGALAATFFLGGARAAGAAAATASPELRALLEAKERLERDIAALRASRASLPAERYEAELERLLVELATTNRRIRELEGGAP